MNKAELLAAIERLPFNKEDYWVVAGSAMMLYDLREETADLDIGITPRLADQLEAEGYPVTRRPDGRRKIEYPGDVDLSEKFLFDRVEMIDGIPVISLEGLLEMKRRLNRPKDQPDILKLEERLGIHHA